MTDIQRLKVMAERCVENAGAGSGIPIPASSVLELISEIETLKTQVRLARVSAEMTVHQAVGRAATESLLVMHERDQLRAENERLRRFETAYKEFSDKTDWVRPNAAAHELGMHVADILRKRCDDLTSHNQAQAEEIGRLRKIISDTATSCGAAVSVECSLDFMEHLPGEVFSVVSQLRNGLLSAAEEVESWGAYAPEYFQGKHDLPGTVSRIKAVASTNVVKP